VADIRRRTDCPPMAGRRPGGDLVAAARLHIAVRTSGMRRWFFLSIAGLFGYADGSEWGTSHHRMKAGPFTPAPVASPSPLVGEGITDARYKLIWVRGWLRTTGPWIEPLIRRFAPPSPTRGEGKNAPSTSQAASESSPARRGRIHCRRSRGRS
jgi:hypothetical protein